MMMTMMTTRETPNRDCPVCAPCRYGSVNCTDSCLGRARLALLPAKRQVSGIPGREGRVNKICVTSGVKLWSSM